MKQYFLLLLFCATTVSLAAQTAENCELLGIEFHGVVHSEAGVQLFFEAANACYADNLYYYPGFVLISEEGDTIAKENTTYYGIGTNFQTHLLDIKGDFSFPIVGRLELHGSYYQHLFCSFPVRIESVEVVDREAIESKTLKVATNYAGDHLIVDLGGGPVGRREHDFFLVIFDDNGELRYQTTMTTNLTCIPISDIGASGNYRLRIWDDRRATRLASKEFRIE